MFRRWKGEQFVERNPKPGKMFVQGVGLLMVLVTLETLYVIYILWFA
ncbi:hypothetical protein ITK37_004641 [Salmonella enterica]|nr:hypothetical protein [Salmonella enterica]EHA9227488.1 hypothetical protein [Salmonella enterica subsp. enterica serovar Glostrup]EJR4301109.1 hypothetical protein [Salmonella enterica]EJR4403536.1 hypothetical protein [Salmonella enterica]